MLIDVTMDGYAAYVATPECRAADQPVCGGSRHSVARPATAPTGRGQGDPGHRARGAIDARVALRQVSVPRVPIQLQFTSPDEDGEVAVWGSLVNTLDTGAVIKLDHRTGRLIDLYLPVEWEPEPPPAEASPQPAPPLPPPRARPRPVGTTRRSYVCQREGAGALRVANPR